jgi:hypothetical protein
VNDDSPGIAPADLEIVRGAGWTDEAIYFAITVCALFNFYNRWIDASGVHRLSDEAIYFAITVCALFNFYTRWIDATGVHPMSDEAHRLGGKRMATGTYARQ